MTEEGSIAATLQAGGPVDEAVLRQAEQAVGLEWKPGDVILDLYEVRKVTEGFGEQAVEKDYHEGGFGRVYKVWHRTWRREMAVKTPRLDAFATQKQKDVFTRECETWINLGLHPHIAPCHYVRELGGVPRVFSEYASADTLEDWIRSKRLYDGDRQTALARMLDVAIQFAWGLHYGHERGVIHQDVKPINALMWDDGTLKVTDFGLAGARQKARHRQHRWRNRNHHGVGRRYDPGVLLARAGRGPEARSAHRRVVLGGQCARDVPGRSDMGNREPGWRGAEFQRRIRR